MNQKLLKILNYILIVEIQLLLTTVQQNLVKKVTFFIFFFSNSVINLSFSAKSVSFFISLKNVLIIKHNTKAKKIFGLKTVCMA